MFTSSQTRLLVGGNPLGAEWAGPTPAITRSASSEWAGQKGNTRLALACLPQSACNCGSSSSSLRFAKFCNVEFGVA